jgi:hypothetical protein
MGRRLAKSGSTYFSERAFIEAGSARLEAILKQKLERDDQRKIIPL